MAENLLSLYAQTARGMGNPQNALAQWSPRGQPMRNYLSQSSDDEAMANYLAMQPQQPVRNGLDRDALLPWAYEVKDGQRNPTGQFAVPQIGVDVWNAVKSVGNAPLTAPYNPAERDSMIEHAGAVVGPMAGVGIARGAITTAPKGAVELGVFGGRKGAEYLAAQGIHGPKRVLDMMPIWEGQGLTRDQIWARGAKELEGTPYAGPIRGADKQPKFEIDDSGAKINYRSNDPLDQMLGAKGVAGDVVSHSELYRAYPDVAGIQVDVGPFKSTRYSRDPSTGSEAISIGGTLNRRRGNLAHEFDHTIQDREGFGSGGSPNDMFQIAKAAHPNANPAMLWDAAVKSYEALDGETWARGTQGRVDLTAAERRAKPPVFDVPMDQQIVTKGNNGPQYSLPDQPGINYVVPFDASFMPILRKYGLLPPAVAGAAAAFNPDQAQARQ